ncbi:MAG TPA: hypothetical protein VI542_37885 [Candidatus Tectomicrobia bacterium]
MANVVCRQHITHQNCAFFGGSEVHTCERVGTSFGYENLGELAAREGSHIDEFVYSTRMVLREHLQDVHKELAAQGVTVWTRSHITYVLMVAVMFITGCGLHLHRPEDAQLARTASTAFKDAKLTDALKAEFDAAGEMLNDEIAVIRRQSNARRDRLISAIIGGQTSKHSWERIVDYANRRLDELLGPQPAGGDWPDLTKWIAARENTYQRFDTVRQAYRVYEQLRTPTDPRITRIGARLSKSDESGLKEPIKTSYEAYTKALTEYDTKTKEANTPPSLNGIVGATATARDDQERKLRDASEAAQKAKDALESVKKEREKKIAEASAPGKQADEISKALKKVADNTNAAKGLLQGLLDTASDRGLTGVQEKSTAIEEIRKQLAELLSVTADAVAGKEPSPGESEQIKLLASLTAIRVGVDGAKYPRVSDLILESERLRIELDRLRDLIALEEERKTLLDLQLTALSREITGLRRAKERAEKARPWSVLALEKEVSKKEAAADALAYLAESWSIGRTPAEEIDFLIFGIDHRAALENSSAAFAQWTNLIGVPLSQLVAYHESGIRSEDLANLINAAGLSAIAAGVH